MYYSVENRSPFLDRQLFEAAYSIPENYLIKDGTKKSILRDSVRSIIPKPIINNPVKIGFNGSLNDFLDKDDPSFTELLLDNNEIFNLVNKDKVEKLLKKKDFSNSESKFIFNFINTKIFLEQAF